MFNSSVDSIWLFNSMTKKIKKRNGCIESLPTITWRQIAAHYDSLSSIILIGINSRCWFSVDGQNLLPSPTNGGDVFSVFLALSHAVRCFAFGPLVIATQRQRVSVDPTAYGGSKGGKFSFVLRGMREKKKKKSKQPQTESVSLSPPKTQRGILWRERDSLSVWNSKFWDLPFFFFGRHFLQAF